MKRLIFILAAMVALTVPAASFAATTAKTVTKATTKVVAAPKLPFQYGVWLPYWMGKSGAQNISPNLDSLDEISPFSYEINGNGVLKDDLNIGNGSWDSWFGAVKELGIKIIPTVAWFNGAGIQGLLSSAKSRQAAEDTIAALVKSKNFNGIDIDFESMEEQTQPYYSLFIQGLAQRLHPQKKLLTCTVIARTPPAELYTVIPDNIVYPEDYTVLNKYCDEVRIMAYDQDTIDLTLNAQKGNGVLYAPVADPAWVSSVLKETLKTINPKKVMLGVPTYGYEYEVSWVNGVTTYARVRAFDYMDAMDRADSLSVEPTRDNADELSLTFASSTHINVGPVLTTTVLSPIEPAVLTSINPNASTTFFASFPDAQSIQDKITLAKKYGIRGIMLFKADGDLDPAVWGILK